MKRRLCSAFAAVLLLIGVMAGCSNVTYVARVNGTEVPLLPISAVLHRQYAPYKNSA